MVLSEADLHDVICHCVDATGRIDQNRAKVESSREITVIQGREDGGKDKEK